MKTLTQIVDSLTAIEERAALSRHAVTVAILLWLAISALAIWQVSPEFFSRAGAVGTGMVLASFALVAQLRQSYHTLLLKGLVLVMRGEHEGKPPKSLIDYDHNLEAISRLFHRLDRRGTPARIAEVGAAVISTLQWGYGDLLLNKLEVCGAWKC